MDFRTFFEAKQKTLISVDIQPEYYHKATKYGGFSDELLQKFINELNSNNYTQKIVLYNGYDTLGMINKNDYMYWLIENGLEEDKLDDIQFYDKGYAFFRFCLDSGIDEDDIVLLVKFMKINNINDSREIKESELWNKFIQEYDKPHLRELLEDADDCIHIPDLMDFLKSTINSKNITLIGGGANECLKEVEIALQALDIAYEKNNVMIYETQIVKEKYAEKL